jgi:hypothetical protein
VDAEEERQRLIADAAERGVDESEALGLAEDLARLEPLPDAYRAVDRRLATGYSVEEAREMLLDESPTAAETLET